VAAVIFVAVDTTTIAFIDDFLVDFEQRKTLQQSKAKHSTDAQQERWMDGWINYSFLLSIECRL